MKILALDVGDIWIGIAISDALRISCRPMITVKSNEIYSLLEKLFNEEPIDIIVVGYPITMTGGESIQTKKVDQFKLKLEHLYPSWKGRALQWILWDERLSSKRAGQFAVARSKEEKLKEHARAASFILQSYLDFISINNSKLD